MKKIKIIFYIITFILLLNTSYGNNIINVNDDVIYPDTNLNTINTQINNSNNLQIAPETETVDSLEEQSYEESDPSIHYEGHVEGIGWQDWVRDGELAGTEYIGKRLEGIQIKLINLPENVKIQYRGHVEDVGWQTWVTDGELAGTAYIGKRLEGIQIKLINSEEYSIQYRGHVEDVGWQDWVADGELAGTAYIGKRLEGIQIRLIPKINRTLQVQYRGHAEGIGWQNWVTDGELAGTAYIGKRLEGIRINLLNAPVDAKIEYRGHVEGIGWQNWVSDGNLAGTDYVGKRLEGIQIRLVNIDGYSVRYRGHVEGIGWQDWVSDGELAGTAYMGKRLEGIQIEIVPEIPKDISIKYKVHSSEIGWQNWTNSGETGGDIIKSIEGMRIELVNAPEGIKLEYQGHVYGTGWQEIKSSGNLAGTEYIGRTLEGICIRLIGSDKYSVQYRAYLNQTGWQDWVSDGELAGTAYQGIPMNGIQIRIVPKITHSKIGVEEPVSYMFSRDNLIVSGWGLTQYDNTVLKIYLNGNEVKGITRTERQDILDTYSYKTDMITGYYGGKDTNPTPGFTANVDITEAPKGNNEILIRILSENGATLCERKITIFVYDGEYWGIDVSHHQGTIDWQKVKNTGIEFVMIRIGYRGYETGKIVFDKEFVNNIEGAKNVGIKIGLYFFTQAINEAEAIEEADWIIDNINSLGYSNIIKYPIAIDSEYSSSARTGRADYLSVNDRTQICKAFSDRIKERGYKPMVYASKNWYKDNLNIAILQNYDIWVAHYTNDGAKTDYNLSSYTIWQYTSYGSLDGINGNVDFNISYKNYN